MAKKSYWEGWGFNDTFKVILTGDNKDVANGLREIKQAFPSSDSEKINAKSFYVFVYDNELTLVKKIAKMFNLKVSYETGGSIGEVIATSNPYVGGAKAIQGIAPESVSAIDRKMARQIYPDPNRPVFFENGGGVDIIAPFGTLVSKNKQQKLEYKKVGSNFEFMIYEGVNNPVSNYSRTSFKKSKNGSIIMNYNEFLKFIYSKGFVDDQKYTLGGGVPRKMELYDAVLYKGETWFYTEKNGVKGITNTSQGAWGSDYPFIALNKLDVNNDLTDMYGNKVKFSLGGGVGNLVYVLYGAKDEADVVLNANGKRNRGWWQSNLTRKESDELLKDLKAKRLINDAIIFTGDKRNLKFVKGGGVSNSEMNEILQDLERNYLTDRRGLNLNFDKEQIQNGRIMWENYPKDIKGRLYQYLKKYDIFGEYQNIWVGDLEKINNFKAKIKELKSNGYSVIQKISAPTKDRTKSFRFIAVKPLQKFDNGGTTGSTDYSVAQTILNQLGGMKRLVIMTGAYNFVASSNAVSFRIKNRKVNYIKITLNGNDLYDLKFSRIVKYNEKVVKEYSDIYFDQLIPIFEETTGMYLRMFKKGGFINTQNRDMVIAQLKTIHHHEEEMLETLKRSGEVEAWVLSKVSNASSDLSDVAHYLEFNK
jgi:uncharacterized LabA/DUF88 family protein